MLEQVQKDLETAATQEQRILAEQKAIMFAKKFFLATVPEDKVEGTRNHFELILPHCMQSKNDVLDWVRNQVPLSKVDWEKQTPELQQQRLDFLKELNKA